MQHDDLVGTRDGAELVGYDDDRLARDDLADGTAHPLLVLRVDERCRLVEHDDGRILENCPGKCDALALATRQSPSRRSRISVVAFFQISDKIVALRPLGGLNNLLVGRVGPADADVLEDAPVKEEQVLRHIGYLLAQGDLGHIVDVLTTYRDGAARHIVVVDQKARDGALATSALPHQRGHAALIGRERDTLQHLGIAICETHVLKHHPVAPAGKVRAPRLKWRLVQGLLKHLDLEAHLRDGTDERHAVQQQRSYSETQAQHQHAARERHPPQQHHEHPKWQRVQHDAREQATVERHPRPADPVPSQGLVAIARHRTLELLAGISLTVEHAYDLHALHVFDDGVVQALRRGKVAAHFVDAHAVHLPGHDDAKPHHDEGEKRHLPVNGKCRQEHDRDNGDVCRTLGDHVC